MNLTVCKKVCDECPFSTESLPGWLGPHSIGEVQTTIQFEGLFSCHKQRKENPDLNLKDIESGKHKICRGFILSASKSCKMFGQNPVTGSELRKLQMAVTEQDSDDKSKILSKWGFKEHHEKYN